MAVLGNLASAGQGWLAAGLKGIKNILPLKRDLILTQLVQALVAQHVPPTVVGQVTPLKSSATKLAEKYRCIDPLAVLQGVEDGEKMYRVKSPFKLAYSSPSLPSPSLGT